MKNRRIFVRSSSLTLLLLIYEHLYNHLQSYWFRDSPFHYASVIFRDKSMSVKRISEDAKKTHLNYFDEYDFPVNDPFSRYNYPVHKELDLKISRFGLQKYQAARQLRKWKSPNTLLMLIYLPPLPLNLRKILLVGYPFLRWKS